MNEYKIKIKPFKHTSRPGSENYENVFMSVWQENEDDAIRNAVVVAENTQNYEYHERDSIDVTLIEEGDEDYDDMNRIDYSQDYQNPIDYF